MGQRKARQAQVWAVKLAEELSAFVIRENISFPYDLKNYPVVLQGQAIRHCQEVNLAKKQHDSLQRQLGKPGISINWVTKYKLIDPPRQPGDLTDYRPRAVLYLDYARGRTVTNNTELEQTVDTFIQTLHQSSPPEAVKRDVLEPVHALPNTQAEADPQEEMIKKMYGL